MDPIKCADDLLSEIHSEPYEILHKCINASLYPKLDKASPDSHIIIVNLFSKEMVREGWANCESILSEYGYIVPFAETFNGGSLICVGFGKKNLGEISLYDPDFGHFILDENIEIFSAKLTQDMDELVALKLVNPIQ